MGSRQILGAAQLPFYLGLHPIPAVRSSASLTIIGILIPNLRLTLLAPRRHIGIPTALTLPNWFVFHLMKDDDSFFFFFTSFCSVWAAQLSGSQVPNRGVNPGPCSESAEP